MPAGAMVSRKSGNHINVGSRSTSNSAEATNTAEVFSELRPLLFSIAYRMLGSVASTEDILQEAWLRIDRSSNVESPKAFLSAVVTRLAIDELRSARVRRESYSGI